MAVTPWFKRFQQAGTLEVFVGANFTGMWKTALAEAIKEFNQLMSSNGVKLTLTTPTGATETGAQVVVQTANGKATPNFGQKREARPFDGNGLHGLTVNFPDHKGVLEKSYVFVPSTPRVDPGNKKSREVGQPVRTFLLVHEFIHAAGLSNDEHTNDDCMCYPGEIVAGNSAADDRVQPWGGLGKPMPPCTMIAKTVANLKKAWPSTGASTP
jgi:hypothetical protein